MSRFLVVDDHPLVRRGIVQVLSEVFPGAAIGEATDGAEALKAINDESWDLVVLDLSLPGRTGLDLLKEIRVVRPRLPVLVFSAHPEEQFATRALRAGASGYVSKGSRSEVLVGAIRTVLSGRKFVSASLGEALADDLNRDSSKPLHESLSDREYDVMLRIASGKTVSEVAAEMHLSVTTISTYRTRILEKMRLKNNAQLTQYAVREKLIEI